MQEKMPYSTQCWYELLDVGSSCDSKLLLLVRLPKNWEAKIAQFAISLEYRFEFLMYGFSLELLCHKFNG